MANPDNNCVYLAMTRRQAKKNIWPILKVLNRKFNLNLDFNETDLEVRLTNGSFIMLVGCDDSRQVDKLRGNHYELVVVDEAASFGISLDNLIDDVIGPALLDNDGTFAMIGTPGAACVGPFHDVTNIGKDGWSVHKWTVFDNVNLPKAKAGIEHLKQIRGWDDNDPTYLREYCGRWVRDANSLVYSFTVANVVDQLPKFEHHVLGVDLGFDDATALSVVSWNDREKVAYIHDSTKESGCVVSEVADKITSYTRRYAFDRIVVDQGGLGKMIVQELSQRYQLPLHAAEKSDKAGMIKFMNSDLKSGRVKVLAGDDWTKEAQILQWDETHRREDGRFQNHVTDCVLYAYRESRHWLSREEIAPPKSGTSEFYAKLESDLENLLVKRIKSCQNEDLASEIDTLEERYG